VKSFSGPDALKKVNMLQRVRHKNFNAFLDECFVFDDCYYVILEHAIISLAHIIKSPAYPTDRQLAAKASFPARECPCPGRRRRLDRISDMHSRQEVPFLEECHGTTCHGCL
jgi:hypothetical protein